MPIHTKGKSSSNETARSDRPRTASGRARAKLRLVARLDGNQVRADVFQGDAVHFLGSLPSECAALVFLDPPFNLGKQYSPSDPRIDLRAEPDYKAWLTNVLIEAVRVLAPGGTLYLYHMPKWALQLGPTLMGVLDFRHWIAVSMKNGFARGRRLYPAHYALLMFSKGSPTNFARPKLKPQACRHCGRLVKDYGGYRSIIEEQGLNLSDIWDDLSPVRHRTTKTRSANELPRALFDRIMAISGAPGELFVDPFAGSGGGIIAAARASMRVAACDLLRSNCTITVKRLRTLDQTEDNE